MHPSTRRHDGAETIHSCHGQTALGGVLVASSVLGLCAILLGNDDAELESELTRRFPKATFVPADSTYAPAVDGVIRLVDEPATPVELPLDIRGTAFQRRVWEELRRIPAGRTATYSEIAANLGAPKAYRAVAGACGANPLAVAIPCHRAVGSNGSFGGYRWGTDRKRALLGKEGCGLRT
ncbi:MAG: methylated-DNA--[protein]-cysteine S-methyltransferase [Actinomycetota bacterium]